MEPENIIEVIRRLIGPIQPTGESHSDDARFANLENLLAVMKTLHCEVDEIGYEYKDAHQYSLKRAADRCSKYLDDLGIPQDS